MADLEPVTGRLRDLWRARAAELDDFIAGSIDAHVASVPGIVASRSRR